MSMLTAEGDKMTRLVIAIALRRSPNSSNIPIWRIQFERLESTKPPGTDFAPEERRLRPHAGLLVPNRVLSLKFSCDRQTPGRPFGDNTVTHHYRENNPYDPSLRVSHWKLQEG